MSEEKEKKAPANVYEVLDKMVAQQEAQQKQLELLGKAIVALNEKLGAQPAQQQGGGDFWKLLGDLATGGKKGISIEDFAKTARYFAAVADVVDRYRHPVLPYSGADRFLMKAGARHVYRTIYEGVKTREGKEIEMPNEEQLDKMLGFGEEKKEEEKREKGHAT